MPFQREGIGYGDSTFLQLCFVYNGESQSDIGMLCIMLSLMTLKLFFHEKLDHHYVQLASSALRHYIFVLYLNNDILARIVIL
jgi:hypothetical protein